MQMLSTLSKILNATTYTFVYLEKHSDCVEWKCVVGHILAYSYMFPTNITLVIILFYMPNSRTKMKCCIERPKLLVRLMKLYPTASVLIFNKKA